MFSLLKTVVSNIKSLSKGDQKPSIPMPSAPVSRAEGAARPKSASTAWQDIDEAAASGTSIECYVEWADQYGVLVNFRGVEIYVGRRYLGISSQEDHHALVGQKLAFRINGAAVRGKVRLTRTLDREGRAACYQALREASDSLVGESVVGVVTRVRPYQVSVRLDKYPCAVAVFNRKGLNGNQVRDLSEQHFVGDRVEATITRVRPNRGAIHVLPVQYEVDPWVDFCLRHRDGDVVMGRISGIKQYGVFVDLSPGVRGLIRVPDLDWMKIEPAAIGKAGDQIEIKILEIDLENRKILLSRKEVTANPRVKFALRHKEGDALRGKVAEVTNFGVFVELAEHVQGLMHKNTLQFADGTDRQAEMVRRYRVGAEVDVVVKQFWDQGARIALAPAER